MAVNVVVVGLGYWGPNIARAIASVAGGRLYGICDIDPDRLARYAGMYPGSIAFPSVEAALGDPAVQAVVVAIPVDSHFDIARRSIAAGRHVLVEKPLARSSD